MGPFIRVSGYLEHKGLPRTRALDFASGVPLYWGDQPSTAGPAYIGAIIFFLFFLGLFLVKGKVKWWLLGGVIMSLLLSWGKNFSLLTDFMIDYFPLYDKFRAVSSIQVIIELCAPVLAILALAAMFDLSVEKTKKLKALKISFFAILGLGITLFVFKGMFDFESPTDEGLRITGMEELADMVKSDRKMVYNNDLFRSLIFVILTATAIWLYLKEKLKRNLVIVVVGALIVFDLVGVDMRYVNEDNFVAKRKMTQPFVETPSDKLILKDESVFRVYDPRDGLSNARTSYFHQSISGYHAAKPAKFQDLFEFHISRFNLGVLNMLNVKYIIQQDEEGRSYPAVNPDTNGNAWFIEKLNKVKSSNEEILALEKLDTKNEAVINIDLFDKINRFAFRIDSTANISLIDYEPNHLTYEATNLNAGVAVFSEMYYAHGWNAYVDGQAKEHFSVNYALRALKVPEGKHTIEFKIEPKIVETGSRITLASSILLGLIVLGGLGFSFWRSKREEKEEP